MQSGAAADGNSHQLHTEHYLNGSIKAAAEAAAAAAGTETETEVQVCCSSTCHSQGLDLGALPNLGKPASTTAEVEEDHLALQLQQQSLQQQQQQQPLQQQPLQQQQQQQLRPCWPPSFAARPKAAVAARHPFLTTVCGSLPCVPADFEEAIQWYCQPGACRLPNIDLGGVNQHVKSWSHAAKLLRSAAAAAGTSRQLFWTSLVADITHPAWWPKTGHVPTYDVVIVGAGASGIGLHRYVDHSCCSNPPPVATYLTIARGKKHVILLPPEQTLFPVDDNIPFPATPTAALLQAIKATGGAFFDLQPTPAGDPVTLFMPTGWLHWLMGASEWHVVYGGSCHMPGSTT